MFCFGLCNTHPGRARFLTAIPLGIVAGLICVALAGQHNPEVLEWQKPLFWTIFSDRVLIGLVIGFAGAFTRHPVFGWSCFSWLRGAALGALVSLPLAFGSIVDPTKIPAEFTPTLIFWATVGSGAVYGLIIDLIATKVGGQGKEIVA